MLTNNSVTIAIDLLWRAINNDNFKLVVVCPFVPQVRNIFEKIKMLTSGVSPIGSMIVKNTENPPIIKFSNGSTIKGFVANDSVTGQSANVLIYDESDYISDYVKDRTNPITLNFPDHVIIHSSTPSGRRDSFYRTCTKDNYYVEFHYPSMVSPSWNEITENQYKESTTNSEFEHEYMAEFGDPNAGVFRSLDLDNAIEKSRVKTKIAEDGKIVGVSYTYDEFYDDIIDITHEIDADISPLGEKKKKGKPTFIIGVDWNGATNGTQIVVLCVVLDIIYVANIISIHSEEFTQTKALEAIIDLNLKYDPLAIYVDVGYGGQQIELLHLYGKNNPLSGIKKKVVGVDFTKKIEIPDPITAEITKKRLKQFMIDRLQRLLESGQFVIPETEDDNERGLAFEMRNFEIERYSDDGSPIYSKKSADHKIAATGLAVLAYSQLIEKVDRFNLTSGTSRISKTFSALYKRDICRFGGPSRTKLDSLVRDDKYPTPKRTIASVAKLDIPFKGIIRSESINEKDDDDNKVSSSNNEFARKYSTATHSKNVINSRKLAKSKLKSRLF